MTSSGTFVLLVSPAHISSFQWQMSIRIGIVTRHTHLSCFVLCTELISSRNTYQFPGTSVFVSLAFLFCMVVCENDRPIIGILTQPAFVTDLVYVILNYSHLIFVISNSDGGLASYGNAYIAASYVKYIEVRECARSNRNNCKLLADILSSAQSAGARVVPIFFNQTTSQLQSLLGSINGVLFPGGGASFSGVYLNAAETIWNYVLYANSHGDYFPLWGTCKNLIRINEERIFGGGLW